MASQSLTSTLRISPPGAPSTPGGGPKPSFEMYSKPSGSKGEAGGKEQGSSGVLSIRTCCRPLGSIRIQTNAPVKSQAQHLAQAGRHDLEVTARSDMEHALGVELIRIELAQVADIEDTVVGNHRRYHMTL